MASLVSMALLFVIFGFFIYEIINEFNKLCGLSLNPYFAIVPAVLVYVVHQSVIKKLRGIEKAVPIDKPIAPIIDKVFYIIGWILVASFFLGILAVWAGVIYKQIIKGMSG